MIQEFNSQFHPVNTSHHSTGLLFHSKSLTSLALAFTHRVQYIVDSFFVSNCCHTRMQEAFASFPWADGFDESVHEEAVSHANNLAGLKRKETSKLSLRAFVNPSNLNSCKLHSYEAETTVCRHITNTHCTTKAVKSSFNAERMGKCGNSIC